MPFVALWVGISVIFALIGGAAGAGNIAWTAHVGGFLGGFALMRLKAFKL
jgi:membrane associated rhomboid family serine protease